MPNYKLTPIADCVIGLCHLRWNPIKIQAILNQMVTGNRSEIYALVQRQKEISMAQTV